MLAAKTPRGPCEAEETGDNESKVAQLAHAVQHYKEIVRDQSRRILAFERQIDEQQETIESLLSQKGLIFDNFCILRQKYDGVKAHLSELLWVVMPSGYIPGVEGKDSERLEGIPPLTQYIVESPKQIGNYEIGDVLGEGQFASVRAIRKRPDIDRSCESQDGSDRDQEGALKRPNSSHCKWSERAAKIINKADVMSLTTLRRVDNEIAVLRHLKHEGVMELHEVIHAPACLYMVTDKAGRDLFDFFDEHLEGVSEAVACLLMHKIMTPLHYCHSMGVVHRDLKPENILFADKKPLTKATPVVLCDFGLCARVGACGAGADTQSVLKEFCGSPGFFAPEMLTKGVYDGKKADVWSIGCILLELVLGHEDFCRLWMTAYDCDRLKDKGTFHNSITQAVADLRQELPVSVSPLLSRFLLEMLDLDSRKRPTTWALLQHEWMMQHNFATEAPEQVAVPSHVKSEKKSSNGKDLKIVVPDCYPNNVGPRQVHRSLREPRDRSLPQSGATPTTLQSSQNPGEGEGCREKLVSQREGSIESDHIRLEIGGLINAPSVDQAQPIRDRRGRALLARQRRNKSLPDTPTIHGACKEMFLPTAGSMARDASCQDAHHITSKEASWSLNSTPGVSPRVPPVLIPAEAMNPFLGNDMEGIIALEKQSEKCRMHSCSWKVDAEYTLPEDEDESSTEAVYLIPDSRGGDESTVQEDTACR